MDPGSLAAFNNLTDDLCTLLIVVVSVLGPVWLLIHYMKFKSARKLDPNETALLEQMTRIAQRMDNRLTAVERVLDSESPAWRTPHDAGGKYEPHPL